MTTETHPCPAHVARMETLLKRFECPHKALTHDTTDIICADCGARISEYDAKHQTKG